MNAQCQSAPTKWRPSNGTEGFAFISVWCEACERDKDQSCPILAATFAHDVHDPEYPTEWCLDASGAPQCTAFVPEGEPVPALRCPHTLDMFEERAP